MPIPVDSSGVRFPQDRETRKYNIVASIPTGLLLKTY